MSASTNCKQEFETPLQTQWMYKNGYLVYFHSRLLDYSCT